MISNEEFSRKKAALEEALYHTEIALGHDEYKNDFVFKRMDRMKGDEFKTPLLSEIVAKCISRNIGFDPDLLLQHIEKEALNQFNDIVIEKIKGISIPVLMEMRHEAELFMLKDRNRHYKEELEKMNRIAIEQITGVSTNEEDSKESSSKKTNNKTNGKTSKKG